MFKLESYITPIILSYVEKYVKNIRPQDSQVSLWGGEVAFQNLDLCLDVLEEELQLPFNLLSGHVHELIIYVPWTKIASEPISITINTIELVLKLKTGNEIVPRKKEPKKKISKLNEVQAPPGYMANLVNKIANNISIKCNNIIFKYIEEDIVVSMNIQRLTFDSADANWKPAFFDISPLKVLMRKVINVKDFTICLDKRNASGKIEVCQEPILYRSTFILRLIRKYNTSTANQSSVTRIDIHTTALNLNISSQQFPMAMRLLFLLQNLKQGKIKSQTEMNSTNDHNSSDAEVNDADVQSYFTWMWNLLPTIFPDDEDDDEEEEIKGHIVHLGMFVDVVKIVFNSQEVFGEPIVYSSKKIKYVPFLEIMLNGIYFESISLGMRWFNMAGGVSNIIVSPVGDCPCGSKQGLFPIFHTVNIKDNTHAHYKNSLMDPDSIENLGRSRNYLFNWDVHLLKVNERMLLDKTPAFAFDMLHQVENNDDSGRSISELSSDLEYSNLSEKVLYRIFFGSFYFNYGATFNHIMNTIKDYINLYDYAPYVEDAPLLTLSQLSPPSTDDYEALMSEIPKVIYEITIVKPIINIGMSLHQKPQKKISNVQKITYQQLLYISKASSVSLSIEIDRISAQIVLPIYPNRLVYTTCQLPEPPAILFNNCHNKISLSVQNTTLKILSNQNKSNLVHIPTIDAELKILIRPELWNSSMINIVINRDVTLKTDIQTHIGNLLIKSLDISFNRPQFYVFNLIMNLILNEDSKIKPTQSQSILISNLNDTTSPILEIQLENITLKLVKNKILYSISFDIHKIMGYLYIPNSIQFNVNRKELEKFIVISSLENLVPINLNDNLLSFILQYPVASDTHLISSIVLLRLSEIYINISPILIQFLNYDLSKFEENSLQNIPENDIHSEISETPKKLLSEKIVKKHQKNLESVHSSSEKDTTTIVTTKAKQKPSDENYRHKLKEYFNFYNSFLINVEIKQTTFFISDSNLKSSEPEIGILSLIENHPNIDIAVVKLPFVTILSSQFKPNFSFLAQDIPITLCSSTYNKDRDGFPWSMSLWGFSLYTIQNGYQYPLLEPVKTNVTLALTLKENNLDSNIKTEEEMPFSIFFHIDTAPAILNFYEDQLSFVYGIINSLSSIPSVLLSSSTENNKGFNIEIAQRPVSPDSNVDLKEFLGISNTPDSVKDSLTIVETQKVDEEIICPFKIPILLQWTFTKFSINMYGKHNNDNCKLTIDFEDIITSVDRQLIYSKLKMKIGSLSGELYEQKSNSELWHVNKSLGFFMRTDSNLSSKSIDDTFLDVTITKAETGNVHSKWGTNKKDKSLNDYLTEIMINMQQIEFRIDLDLLAIFSPILNFTNINEVEMVEEDNDQKLLCVADLPLIYFECKGLRIFVSAGNDGNKNCDVCIIKINNIVITPNVQNPLTRVAVRPDIYTKAAQLRIINARGSKIEDRQYELLLKGISIATGNWFEISTYMETHTVPTVLHENPAFEWNNKPDTRNAVEITTVFKDFNFSLVFAPCIIFKNVLVCGPGLELNCLTDLVIDLNTTQLSFGQLMLKKLDCFQYQPTQNENESNNSHKPKKNIETTKMIQKSPKQSLFNNKSFNQTRPLTRSTHCNDSILSVENILTDSGFGSQKGGKKSSLSINTKGSNSRNKKSLVVPFEVWFIGGIFTIKCYHTTKLPNATENVNDKENIGYIPLLHISVYQPNLMISQTIYEKVTQMSIFDVTVGFGSHIEKVTTNKTKFNDIIFKTKQGDLDSHGIPQSILKIKCRKNILQDSDIEIELKRPIKLTFSHKTIEKIYSIQMILNELLNDKTTIDDQNNQHLKAIENNYKMKTLKSNLFGLKRINLLTTQISLELSHSVEYNLKVAFDKLQVRLEILDIPEKINFNILLKSLMINTNKLIILHPLIFDIFGNLIQENWNKFPSIFFTLKSNFIQIDIGPENIVIIRKIQNSFINSYNMFNIATVKVETKTDVCHQIPIFENKTQIPTPKLTNKSCNSNEEYYQDDLRAGAFQFIESQLETDMPLPYQILINNAQKVICWRYPQPRCLNNIKVYPVPFHTTADINIKCKLQYYSEPHSTFLTYCSFDLSENETKILNLPKRRTTSSIWRVVMIQSMVLVNQAFFIEDDTSLTDQSRNTSMKTIDDILRKNSPHSHEDYIEDEIKESIFHLNPKALVACMQVDSFFSPALVPNLQGVINISQIRFNFINNLKPENNGLKLLKQYTRINDVALWQTFFTIYINNFKFHAHMFGDMHASIHTEFNISSEILDYSYLSMQPFTENFTFKSFVEIGDEINLNLIMSEIQIRYGPSIGHALAVSEQIWTQVLSNSWNKQLILTRFVICNETTNLIRFGQADTDEEIILKSKECCLYSFRSENKVQSLSFMVEDNSWIPSSPVAIKEYGLQYVNFPNCNQLFVIKTEKLSPSQMKVMIKGQIEFLNMTMYHFVIAYKSKDGNSEFEIKEKSNLTIFGASNEKAEEVVKMKIGSPSTKGWSGEIPLSKFGNNNRPWLVKIRPSAHHNMFLSFWVRVVREDLPKQNSFSSGPLPQRVLVTIWPLFMVKSMLTVNTLASEKGKDEFSISGKGEVQELSLSGTHEDDHELLFKMNSLQGEEKRGALLSYKLIDKNTFFNVPKKFVTIEQILEELQKPLENNWPCSREEELRWNRQVSIEDITTPVFNCSLSREMSCSLMLTITAWCLFINSTSSSIKIINADTNNSTEIGANLIAMPFVISKSFYIWINDFKSGWKSSSIIHLNESRFHKNSNEEFYVLADEGNIEIKVCNDDSVSKLVLSSTNENGYRVMHLSTTYVVCNFTEYNLTAYMYSITAKEKQSIVLPTESSTGVYSLFKNSKLSENSQGNPIDNFCNLSYQKQNSNNYNYFAAIAAEGNNEHSCPISLNKPFDRKSICVVSESDNIPLTLSLISHNDQLFLSIYKDEDPFMEIINRTSLRLFVAQSNTLLLNRTAIAIKECIDENFDWYQIIEPNSKIFYTPHDLDKTFPEIIKTEIGIIFSLVTSNNIIQWTQPIQISSSRNIFLKIPQHGDIKITTDCHYKTIKLFIQNIRETQEFCLRDIRSRLSNPSVSSLLLNDNDLNANEYISTINQETLTLSNEQQEIYDKDSLNNLTEIKEPQKQIKINLFIKEFSLILFGDIEKKLSLKSELLSLNFDNIAFVYDERSRTLNFGCRDFQIDNLRYSSKLYDFPVVLCSQENDFKNSNQFIVTSSTFSLDYEIHKHFDNQLLNCLIKLSNKQLTVDSVKMHVKPIRIYIEDTFLNYVVDYVLECLPNNIIHNDVNESPRFMCANEKLVLIPKLIEKQSLNLADSFKMKSIKIEPLNILLSVHTSVRMYIALDHSPLQFAAFERTNVNTLPMKLGYVLGKHYLEGAAIGAGWVVGSLEILGSPSGLARSVTTGLRDFLSMPVQGFFRGPWGFLIGITQGSASLIKNITAGTVNSVSKLAASVSRNLDWLTLDDDHLMITDTIRRSRPQGVTEGLTQGLAGFGISLLGAVGGLARHPLEARSPVQVVTGVGKGIVGAFTKPLSGAAELVALTGQGMLQSVGYNTLPTPRSCSTINNATRTPASCKLSWKLLPFHFQPNEHVLFSSMATLKMKSGLKPVLLCLTQTFAIFLSIEKEEILELLSVENVKGFINENDSSLITLKHGLQVAPTNINYSTNHLDIIDPARIVISPRTYQFVRDSNDKLPLFSSQHNYSLNDDLDLTVDYTLTENVQEVEFYLDRHLSEYFIRYLSLIQRWISSKRILFSPFEED